MVVRETPDDLIAAMAASEHRPDGLFVSTDLFLTKIHPLLVQYGIRPGKDLRIISCDNENERLAMVNPKPASIDIGGEEIGRWAVRQLVHRLQRPEDPPVRIQVAPRIATAIMARERPLIIM